MNHYHFLCLFVVNPPVVLLPLFRACGSDHPAAPLPQHPAGLQLARLALFLHPLTMVPPMVWGNCSSDLSLLPQFPFAHLTSSRQRSRS